MYSSFIVNGDQKNSCMKKMTLFLAMCCVLLPLSAADIIVTNQLQCIEAKVIAVESDSVLYYLPSAAGRAVLSLPKSDIKTLLFENGEVLRFTDEPQETTQEISEEPQLYEGKLCYADGEFRRKQDFSIICRSDYENLLQTSCTDAWTQYQKGLRMKKAGACCIGLGSSLMAVGIVVGVKSGIHGAPTGLGIGIIMSCVGEVLLGAGIPVFCVGKALWRNSYEPYNEQYFSVNVYPAGVGLAWQF